MANGKPVTPADETRIRDLHNQGCSRNQIAADLGRSGSTISAVCKRLGLVFDRAPQLEEATRAATADIQARTAAARLKEQTILEFEQERVLSVIQGRTTYKTKMRGTGGSEHIQTLDFIPAEDAQKLAMARGSMQATIARMAPKDTDQGVQHAESLLDRLAADLHQRAGGGVRVVPGDE